jgi:anti-sigma regulatory factor (Ser/Thr protein kinase)
MSDQAGRVLVVGDAESLELIRGLSTLENCEVDGCRGEAEALRRLRRSPYDVIVTSRVTSLEEDLAFLEEVRKARPGTREIVVVPSVDRREIIEAIRSHVFALFSADFDPQELARMVRRAVEETDWRDGIELVSGLPNWLSLRVACQLVSAERLVRFIEEMEADVGQQDRRGLLAAFRELLINAMEHGAGFGPDRVVEVSAVRSDRAIVFHFRDPGQGFRLEDLEHAAISNPADDPLRHMEKREAMGLRPGGFGILIARQLADEMYYNEAGNEVLLIKHTS